MPSNYIIFLKNLKEYINMDMKFIKPEDSKYKEYISYKDKRFGSYPMGKLNDIEIHFLHWKKSGRKLRTLSGWMRLTRRA